MNTIESKKKNIKKSKNIYKKMEDKWISQLKEWKCLVCRAHQLVNEGFQYWFKNQNLVTVWSAPNYCYRCGNKASILKIGYDLQREFAIFDSAPESAKSAPPKTLVPYFL